MHELGIVFYIIKDVVDVAKKNNATKVSTVNLDVGEVSGVINSYLLDCWKWAVKKEPLMKECELKIKDIHAISYCNNCHKQFDTVKYGKKCPKCNQENTYLLKGNQVEISNIEII